MRGAQKELLIPLEELVSCLRISESISIENKLKLLSYILLLQKMNFTEEKYRIIANREYQRMTHFPNIEPENFYEALLFSKILHEFQEIL